MPTLLAPSARQRERRHRRDGAGAQRGHRGRVEQRQRQAGRRIRQADDAVDGRQPLGEVGRKRGDPLQQREAAAERRHRAEVAVRRAQEVDLRGHRPLAAVVAQEGLADGVDRGLGGHGGEDGLVVQDGELGHGSQRVRRDLPTRSVQYENGAPGEKP